MGGMTMRRIARACLALALTLGLTGCGSAGKTGGSADDLFSRASGIASDTVLLTVDGRAVSAGRYFYWLAYDCDYLRNCCADSGRTPDWNGDYDGRTLGEYAREQALATAALYAEIELWADRYGCRVTDDDWAAVDREWDQTATAAGGEAAYLTQLADYGVDKAFARELSGDYYLYSHLYELSRTAGSALYPTQAELDRYASDQGLITVEEQRFSSEAAAGKALAALTASAQPLTDFASLGGNDRKITFVSGDGTLSDVLESAALALKQDAWSQVLSDGDGFCLLLRRAPDAAAGYFDAQLQSAADQAKISCSSAYDSIDVASFYQKLTAARTKGEKTVSGQAEIASGGSAAASSDSAPGTPAASGSARS